MEDDQEGALAYSRYCPCHLLGSTLLTFCTNKTFVCAMQVWTL